MKMSKLSPKILFFIFGSILALAARSRGDDTVVLVAAAATDNPIEGEEPSIDDPHIDPPEVTPTAPTSELTCECPPDLSEQLRTTLTTECDSRVAVSNDDIHYLQTEIDRCSSRHTTLVEENDRTFTEHTAKLTTECDSKLAQSNDNILRHQTEIKHCNSQHATYVVNTDRELTDASVNVDRCVVESTALEEERLKLKLEVSSFKESSAIHTKQYDETISSCNAELSSCGKKVTQYIHEMEGCRLHYDEVLQKHESLQNENFRLESVQKEYTQCRQDMAEIQSDYNEALQSKESLMKEHDRLESWHESKTKKMQEEKIKLKIEIERLKKNKKIQQDHYNDERDHVTRLEKELRIMRRDAEITYVNTTLVRQDIVKFTSSNLNRVYDVCDTEMLNKVLVLYTATIDRSVELHFRLNELYLHYCAPAVHSTVDRLKKAYSICVPTVNQKLYIIQNTSFWKMYVAVGIEKVNQALKSVFLTLASAVKQSTTLGLDYIELIQGDDGDAQDIWFLGSIVPILRYMKNTSDSVAKWIILVFTAFLLAPCLVNKVLRFFFSSILFVVLLPFRPFLMVRCWISKPRY